MSKKRIHELAKELQKSNKELIQFLQKNNVEVQSHMSAITDEQVKMVEKAFVSPAPKTVSAETTKKETQEPKKHITAVYRPQNSSQNSSQRPNNYRGNNPVHGSAPQKTRPAPVTGGPNKIQATEVNSQEQLPQGTGYRNQEQRAERGGYNNQNQRQGGNDYPNQGQRPRPASYNKQGQNPQATGDHKDSRKPEGTGYQGQKPQGSGYQGQRPQGSGYQGQRPQGSGYQGQRPQGSGYQGQRPQGSGYQGQRPQGSGYQGQRPQGSGYQGQRPQGSGYQGQRPQGSGYQGQRPQGSGYQGQRSQDSGYQGQRPQGSGYQGQRPQGGGYQGQRPQGGGYQGQRPQGGGYNKDNQRPEGGGYNNRGNTNSNRGGRAGGSKSSIDIPVQQKPQIARQNKAKPTSKYDKKKNHEEQTVLEKGKLQKPTKTVAQVQEIKVDEIKTLILPDVLTIKELAEKMKIQPSAIVKKLFLEGKVVTLNQEIDFTTAEEIAMENNFICEQEVKVDVLEELLKEEEDAKETLVTRPPVVCVMGHVDHGKTSLLDAIRETHVTAKEAGGITQHIGAYIVEINEQKITFLDTPGHEAFTSMRMRGAQSTDIAILVVAADDGVMPQTIEAINHAKAAGVEIIVAINKIDKPSANIDRVKQEMSEYELVPEDWGGSTIFVPVSAHTREGIDTLLEMILLVAEVKELKANPNRTARGLVIEAELDKGKGPVATVLVQKGTLRIGDSIAAGSCYGKVRAMMNDQGSRVTEAAPSTPVEILGLNDVPDAGEIFVGTENDKEARNFAETFIKEGRVKLLEETKAKLSLDDLFTQIKAGTIKELNIIVKADVQGSVEAVKQSLLKLSNEEVVVKIIHGGVGAINESDVILASASNAIIIGFNVRPDVSAKSIAEREKVDLRLYKVIYQAIEDVEAAMKGMLDPVFEEKVLGHATVRQTFKASGVGTIAGAYVLDGKFQRGCQTRISREGKQIYEGPLASLKRFKDDVKEVAAGYECGLVFEKFNDLQEEDTVEAYAMVEVPR